MQAFAVDVSWPIPDNQVLKVEMKLVNAWGADAVHLRRRCLRWT